MSRNLNASQNLEIKIANGCLKMCHGSNIWERQQQIKIWSERKLRGDRILVVLVIIRSRTFCLLVCCRKNQEIKIYKTMSLNVVLYGYDSWSLTLRKEHRLVVFKNWVLGRIFGMKRNEVMEGWRKLPNEKLRKSYSSPSTQWSSREGWDGRCM
jgi:hypothetical protein